MLTGKKHIFLFFASFVLAGFQLPGQNEFVNNGAQVSVQSAGLLFVQGEVINTDNGASTGFISNSGTIALSGDWTNNSATTALNYTTGTVELNGALQLIKGTQSTTFNNLTLLGSNTKRLNINTFVGGISGVLNLTSRPLDLNSRTLFVTNQLPAAIIRTSGYILSETPPVPGYGIIDWQIGNNTGNYEFPFGTNASVYIPFFYNVSAAGTSTGIGSISANTYPTNVANVINNRPLPSGVTDLLNNCATEHANKMIDRFWVVNANNYGSLPGVTKKFTYVDDEWDTSGGSTNAITESNLYTWYNTTSGWAALSTSNASATNEQTHANSNNYGVFTLGEYRQLKIGLLNVDSVKCFGQNNGVIQLTTTTGYDSNSYSWNSFVSQDTVKTNLTAGSYTIIATDALGCSDTLKNIIVNEPALLTETLTSNDYSFCRNTSIQLTSVYSGGIKPYQLSWNTGISTSNLQNNSSAINVTPSISTQYIATLTDKNNCVVADTVLVNVNQLPDADFNASVLEGCQPLSVNFTNTITANVTVVTYQWSFLTGLNSGLSNPNVIYNNPGLYGVSLTVISDSGCVSSLSKSNYITVYEKPKADFIHSSIDTDLSNPFIEFQNSSTGDYSFSSWSFGDGAGSNETHPSHTYNDVGHYYVLLTVSSEHNCSDTITKKLEVKEIPVLYIPNTFTPLNTDGMNDVFTVKGVNFYDFNMAIFNRWGEKILETGDHLQGWDGKYKGSYCQVGTYTYIISYRHMNGKEKGKEKLVTGHINLLE